MLSWCACERCFQESIRNLERKWEIERDRRDREEKKSIMKAREDMLRIQDQHISAVTRQAIEENAQLDLEIAYQSRQSKELLSQNGASARRSTATQARLPLLPRRGRPRWMTARLLPSRPHRHSCVTASPCRASQAASPNRSRT